MRGTGSKRRIRGTRRIVAQRAARGWLVAASLVLFALSVGAAAGAALPTDPVKPSISMGPLDSVLEAAEAVEEQVKSATVPSASGCDRTPQATSHGHPHEHDSCPDDPAQQGSDFTPNAGDGPRETAARSKEGGRGRRSAGSSGMTAGRTTLERTITGDDPDQGFQFLRFGPGEPRIVREDLAEAKPGRIARRLSLLYVAQTTDWQLADEESPARVEFFDVTANEPLPRPFSAAHRPQEALVPHGVELSIRQLNNFADRSPHPHRGGRRAAMDFAILTGDQADNQQFNETRWVVTLLEGGVLDPNSGTDPSACPPGQTPVGQTADPRLYAGVQDYDDYPSQGLQFYDPDTPAGIWADWPTYPGLMDRAQRPFEAVGLAVPSYVTPGNHDGLAQGNQKAIAPFEAVGVGCVKPIVPVTSLTNPDDFGDSLSQVLTPTFLLDLVANNPGQVFFVPPDPDRRYVDKAQYKALFATGAQADAHGFGFVEADELSATNGAASYYGWDAKPGIRMISIDTLCEGGVAGPSSNGNIDDPQFRWLESELERAQDRDQLIIVFGHHPIRSLDCDVPDETPPPCSSDDEHGHDQNPGCDQDPRSSEPLHDGADLEQLLHRFPNAIAYIAGHTHENALGDFDRPADSGPGDFWGIETASLVDWPPQNRLIELMDNCDGTLSLVATIVDSAAPPTAPASGTAADPLDTTALASVSRTLAYNDPQAGPGAGGQGDPEDRNVELLLEDPRDEQSPCTQRESGTTPGETEPAPGGGDQGGGGSGEDEGGAGGGGGELPFTGLLVVGLLAIGASLLTAGRLLRKVSRPASP